MMAFGRVKARGLQFEDGSLRWDGGNTLCSLASESCQLWTHIHTKRERTVMISRSWRSAVGNVAMREEGGTGSGERGERRKARGERREEREE